MSTPDQDYSAARIARAASCRRLGNMCRVAANKVAAQVELAAFLTELGNFFDQETAELNALDAIAVAVTPVPQGA